MVEGFVLGLSMAVVLVSLYKAMLALLRRGNA